MLALWQKAQVVLNAAIIIYHAAIYHMALVLGMGQPVAVTT
jgi:hypothetical protein